MYLNNLDIAQQNLNSTYDTHHITTKTEQAQKNSKKKTSTLKGNYVDLVPKNYQKFQHKGSLKLAFSPRESITNESQVPISPAKNITITNNTNIILFGGKTYKIKSSGTSPSEIILKQTTNSILSPQLSIKNILNKINPTSVVPNSQRKINEKNFPTEFPTTDIRHNIDTTDTFHKRSTSFALQDNILSFSNGKNKEEARNARCKLFSPKNVKSDAALFTAPIVSFMQKKPKIKVIPKLHVDMRNTRKTSLCNLVEKLSEKKLSKVLEKVDPKREKEKIELIENIKKCILLNKIIINRLERKLCSPSYWS